GISGYLRQEFRELELLNEVTKLRYLKELPSSVCGVNRRDVLRTFLDFKGMNHEPAGLHEAIRKKPGENSFPLPIEPPVKWSLVGKDEPADLKGDSSSAKKRAASPSGEHPTQKRIRPNLLSSPLHLIWDASNWSCAYDSLFCALFDIWKSDQCDWT
ncbi:hypothetical protein GGX14DRAFT_330482, partial [Mycena pura]